MPTAEARPWPSGPVVISTPGVWRCSGWPGVLRAPRAQRLEVGELQAVAGEVELDVEREAGVPGGEHEPVAADPVGVGGVVPHDPLEQRVGQRGQAHRGAGVAVADLLHGVRGQHADGVDRAPVEIGPVVRDARPGQRVDVGLGHGRYSLGVGGPRAVAARAGARRVRRAPSSVVTARCPAPGLARSVPIYARAVRRPAHCVHPAAPAARRPRLPSTGCRTPAGELLRRAVRARPLSEVATGERARVPPGIETGPPLPGARPRAGAAGAAPVPRHRAGLRRPHQDPHHRAAPGRHGPGDVPRRAGHPAGPADPRHAGRRRRRGRERARARTA